MQPDRTGQYYSVHSMINSSSNPNMWLGLESSSCLPNLFVSHQTMLYMPMVIVTKKRYFSHQKKKKRSMEGGWVCRTCQLPNFNWRTKCQRCSGPFGRENTCAPGPRIRAYRPGDWFCDAGLCRAHNFATRQYCFRCGIIKSIPFYNGSAGYRNPVFPPVSFNFLGQSQRVAKISRRGWTAGDWFCLRPYCNAHNYGTRVQCYKCKAPKDLVSTNLVASGLQNP
ncbi:uncharacterized protein LOC110884626 isoform X2 [Helianthus annuus]|nr:uncharacterized protein LOC110884626 isoform X2 [Helianthus annuus]